MLLTWLLSPEVCCHVQNVSFLYGILYIILYKRYILVDSNCCYDWILQVSPSWQLVLFWVLVCRFLLGSWYGSWQKGGGPQLQCIRKHWKEKPEDFVLDEWICWNAGSTRWIWDETWSGYAFFECGRQTANLRGFHQIRGTLKCLALLVHWKYFKVCWLSFGNQRHQDDNGLNHFQNV